MPERPNVLIIYTDQHRFDCLGCCGNPDLRTPNIDRLAGGGVRFANAFTSYPVCTPARYSLISGLPAHLHGGFNNHSTPRAGTPFFPQLMAAEGYRTAAVGKMHYTPTYLDVGFGEMLLAEQDGDGRWDDDYHRYLRERGLVDRLDLEDQRPEYRREAPPEYWKTFGARESGLPEEHHSTTWIGDRAVDVLEDWGDGGNLLMAGFVKPHHPFDPPAPWSRAYDPAELELLPGWAERPLERDLAVHSGYFPNASLTEEALRGAMAGYYATISQIDHHVGRMLDLLEERGVLENTVVIFTADHGEYLGFHHMLLKGGYLYDPLTRVPLIVRWPGGARAGTVDERLVSCLDLAPTILRGAGIRHPEAMRGLDLADGGRERQMVFAERLAGKRPDGSPGCQVMVRSRTRKLIRTEPREESLFFDLERDPLEFENAFDRPEYATEIREFEAAAERWLGRGPNLDIHLDERAPRVAGPNVPDLDDGHRAEAAGYFRRAMSDSRTGAAHPGSPD
jgi:arylsulfatase A-like enzyme